jgi:signal transduction histidine kinase
MVWQMFSFRQKIFLTYVAAFLIFLAIMFPFASYTVRSLFNNVMEERASEIIDKIKNATDDVELVQDLRDQKSLFFYRISVISDQHKVLYDSHTKSILGASFSQDFVVHHPEVEVAFLKGVGYHEEYSQILDQKFSYLAKAFDFHGKTYVVRIAFPYKTVTEILQEFEFGFLALATTILLLFSLMTWFIINYLTKPIHHLVREINTYQAGGQGAIPVINGEYISATDEFGQLASTLNALSSKIQHQINNLTQERNEKEAILESLVEGVIAVDSQLVVQYANQSALKFLGVDYQQLAQEPLSAISYDKLHMMAVTCQNENKVLIDTLIVKHQTHQVHLDIVAAPKKENAGAILVLQDKSIHYRMLEMRKDFIANASHELKTPITVILGFAETLHDANELSPDLVKEITGKIVRNSQRMANLIKDLLALSDMESLSEVRLCQIELNQLVQSCCAMVGDAFPGAKIAVESDKVLGLYVTGDPNLLEMAIMNLLENAAKYSHPPAVINVCLAEQGEEVEITIADQGIGIPQANLDSIFERFYTVDKARSRKMGGSGLGLSIVAKAISKHQGKVNVSSKEGEGSSFVIRLPKQVMGSPQGNHRLLEINY